MATRKKTAAPAADADADAVLVAVRALHPLRYNGVDYAEQALLELPEADAAALVAAGWAEPARVDPAELSLV